MIYLEIINRLQQQARINGQRRLLVCSGSAQWCRELVQTVESGQVGISLYIGEGITSTLPVLPARQSKQWLGRELDFLVYDAHCGFDVDAFGAITGTLRAGGLMILLVPELSQWAFFNDPEHKRIQVYPQNQQEVTGYYLQRLAQQVSSSNAASVLCETGAYRESVWPGASHTENNILEPCRTSQQSEAVAAVHKVVRGHRRRPLVLTADRGRGKSAALGIASGQLFNEGIGSIIITAPSKVSAEVIFQHARNNCDLDQTELDHRLVFISPDELIKHSPDTDLLLVDEAAAIPTPLLQTILTRYARIVFASTVHGYEGTGRGFAIRFRKILDKKTPQWRHMQIQQPIRWNVNDPLEAFVFKALLLNAAPVNTSSLSELSREDYEYRRISSEQLISNESLLNELFGLLVLAHYQTRPFDLRHLLDGGNIEVSGLFQQGHLVATVLAAKEGEIEQSLVEPIWRGQRRVRGHLLPQSLSNHVGIADAVTLKGLRIIRIAVHPERQYQGLGRRLLSEIKRQAVNDCYDYLGTSFGATESLLRFWHHCQFKPVRVGITREAASGTHSVMMLQGLSILGQSLQIEAQERFREQFHWLLMDGLDDVEADIVTLMLRQSGYAQTYQQSVFEQRDLLSYIEGQRQYDCCMASVKAWTMRWLANYSVTSEQQRLLVTKVLQNKDWKCVAESLQLSGRKQVQQRLRQTIAEQVRSHSVVSNERS